MKTNYLLPAKIKILGWVILGVGLLFGGIMLYHEYEVNWLTFKITALYRDSILGESGFFKSLENSLFDELTCILIIFGGMLVAFSEEKVEDEFVNKLRKDSLIWALIINYVVLIFTVIGVYGVTFFHVLVFNMFTPLLFFIIRFNFLKLKSRSDEE